MEQVNSTIIQSVVEQHAEEAAFLWLQRDAAVRAPHYSLDDLADLDDRVDAHLDGLRIAGDESWEICKESLAWEEPGEIFTVAFLAFENGIEERIQAVLEAGSQEPDLKRGIISALGWLPYTQTEKYIQKFLTSESSYMCTIGIAACAVHRKDPGQALYAAIANNDSLLKARALRAVGELGRKDLLSTVKANLYAEQDDCRFSAACSTALLGNKDAVPVLRDLTEKGGPHAEEAFTIALRRMNPPDAYAWLRELVKQPEHQRIAIIGTGVIGDPASIPWLIQMMEVPELSRVAGESFTMITGVDIAYEDLEGEWPEGFEAGPTEEPEDEDVEMDPDEDLPWPKPQLITKWWDQNKQNFSTGKRYFLAKPINKENLQLALKNGYQRQRAARSEERRVGKECRSRWSPYH